MGAIRTGVLHKAKDARTGDKWINNYKRLDKIGEGSYGKVSLYVTPENGRLFAVKVRQQRIEAAILARSLVGSACRGCDAA